MISSPNVKLNLTGREKATLYTNNQGFPDTQVLDGLCTVISNYVSKRREAGANTLHAFLYHVIVDLIKTENTAELESTFIWNKVTESLSGHYPQNKP